MNKKLLLITPMLLILFSVLLSGCHSQESEGAKGDYKMTNINIFKDTPVWELAVAVKEQNTAAIEKLTKDKPELLNYQDPKYKLTLLLWAVGMEKYNSAEALLQCGADPNIASVRYETYSEQTPLSLATRFSWVDNDAKKDPKYVKLLLQYGADPNWIYIGHEHGMEPGTSILMESIGCGIEKTKALVEAGADINHKTKRGNTAAVQALLAGGPAVERNAYAHYLIVEKKANVSEPYYRRKNYGNEDPNKKFFPVDILRDWIVAIGSQEYKMKMEIVEEFARQGVNYWDTKIPSDRLKQIKKIHPNTWEEYIKQY
ncbi:ankyrin repeat domain-containing protein [Pelosinus fermentans]|uniref:Ankyrin repeat-containing domain-containing protein n=1 Tax=Pelosinus fermentans B4 TaxID=1149862 RepID=I9B1X2_9FIRM|nr:ankyrin repeat domain-containing protein [Pelosinus fermentans]EIW19147.1 Ankyrin repeat-containing domain-containing protein [Pelosinus fermentans B4]EIW25121.1 Ankyrin [Pelosinus fermentans A11]OAM96128.1 Ankyrin repeat-containing domain-containing protein [Pelosinus fermentans DSM 17108]SDR36651.1 Ankyrin repeat [Pelosinus fermentans]